MTPAKRELTIGAEGFSLPTDFATKSIAILAQRRKGKTYTASVLAEECVACEIPDEVPDEDELQRKVFARVGSSRAAILRQLVAVYPDALPRDELATKAGASPSSSGFANNLGALRTLGLLDYPQKGYVAATDALFLGGAQS